ncbi:MAG TPA: protein translocase subunit SecD [Candidatus Baltobacteraceae bacterium]|nr:protein translocase subunit SecD [Verrucomicrobiae bacterium]HTX14063.1 protein translocase subunit SecD [Candidatus Baltobacteraceae bacterium]
MNSQLRWKFIFITFVILLCIYGIVGLPSFPTSLAQAKDNLADRIKLGLDLKGGSHLVLQVQVEEAIGLRCDQAVDDLTKQIHDKNIVVGEIRRLSDTQILVRNVDPASSDAFRDLVNNQFTDWTVGPAAGEQNGYLLSMKPSVVADIKTQTMDQSLETITRRINALGLTEPTIAFTGREDNEILVQLPGEGDPSRAKAVIQAGGQLALTLVLDDQTYPSEVAALAAHNGILPPGAEILPGRPEGNTPGEQSSQVYYVVSRLPVVTGVDLKGATPAPSGRYPGQYEVDFHLSTAAAARFGPFTENNTGRKMAIVLDGKVYTAPVINSRIDDSGVIEGNFSQQSAEDLALVLRSGALPASIKYLEERTVGPSLGADSIREGVRASVGSLIVVMIFLVIYYRLSGVNAVVALILNLVILVAFMAFAGAVLTLPGIAGVILTIGMGVDSNVLVFERIREELRAGKSNSSSVELGFANAFRTIVDTHVTTVVSAVFLFLFGTGPVRGFAITLTIGLIANLFTSIYVSRAIFDYHLTRIQRQAALSI